MAEGFSFSDDSLQHFAHDGNVISLQSAGWLLGERVGRQRFPNCMILNQLETSTACLSEGHLGPKIAH